MNDLLPDPDTERRLRALALELAAGIQEPQDILKQLGFSGEDYQRIASERVFKELFASALAEWNAAGNTQKRAKLKAATAVENTIHHLAQAISDKNEPLSSRTGAYLALLKTGGMGEGQSGSIGVGGSSFNLTIHLSGKREPMVIGGAIEGCTLESETRPKYTQSALLDSQPWVEIRGFDDE